MDWHAFSEILSQSLEQKIQVTSAHSVSGGDINHCYQLDTNVGNLFVKLNRREWLPMMASEARSLKWIAQSKTIDCPTPLGFGEFENHSWLALEYVAIQSGGEDFAKGRALALMHHQLREESQPFGWFEDNFIGLTPQRNRWHSDWTSFYGEERLRPQLELARLKGASQHLFELGLELIDCLPFWFEDYQPEASLLHGDLWAGNSGFLKDGTPIIFDPASYFGDRETDIAMTELFGGYSSDFYRGYNEVYPLDSGYQSRKTLYNLYHVLNHFNLFGGGYAHQAENQIRQLVSSAGRS